QPYDGRAWGPTASASFTVDTIPPGLTSVSNASHPESPPGAQDSSWKSSRTFTATLGASDVNGVAGYSTVIDRQSATLPGTGSTNSNSNYTNSTSINGDGQWYFHARAKDNAGLWASDANVRHYGFLVDTTAPTPPTIT